MFRYNLKCEKQLYCDSSCDPKCLDWLQQKLHWNWLQLRRLLFVYFEPKNFRLIFRLKNDATFQQKIDDATVKLINNYFSLYNIKIKRVKYQFFQTIWILQMGRILCRNIRPVILPDFQPVLFWFLCPDIYEDSRLLQFSVSAVLEAEFFWHYK